MLEKFHAKPCDRCKVFGSRSQDVPESVPASEFFTWLKKYEESSMLYIPSSEFSQYVRKVSLLSLFCFRHHMSSPKIVESCTKACLKYVWCPNFCSERMKERTTNLVVRTVLNYNIKWLNDTIRSTSAQSQRKLTFFMCCLAS